jgi:hypothetical protein
MAGFLYGKREKNLTRKSTEITPADPEIEGFF